MTRRTAGVVRRLLVGFLLLVSSGIAWGEEERSTAPATSSGQGSETFQGSFRDARRILLRSTAKRLGTGLFEGDIQLVGLRGHDALMALLFRLPGGSSDKWFVLEQVDLVRGATVRTVRFATAYQAMAISPSLGRLAGTLVADQKRDQRVRVIVWNVVGGRIEVAHELRLTDTKQQRASVSFATDELLVVELEHDDGGHFAVFALDTDELRELYRKERTTPVAISMDGKRLAFADRRAVYVIDTRTGKELARLSRGPGAESLAFHPSGQWLAVHGSNTLVIWNLLNKQPAYYSERQDPVMNVRLLWPYDSYLLVVLGSRYELHHLPTQTALWQYTNALGWTPFCWYPYQRGLFWYVSRWSGTGFREPDRLYLVGVPLPHGRPLQMAQRFIAEGRGPLRTGTKLELEVRCKDLTRWELSRIRSVLAKRLGLAGFVVVEEGGEYVLRVEATRSRTRMTYEYADRHNRGTGRRIEVEVPVWNVRAMLERGREILWSEAAFVGAPEEVEVGILSSPKRTIERLQRKKLTARLRDIELPNRFVTASGPTDGYWGKSALTALGIRD